jgi:hypothetical protein
VCGHQSLDADFLEFFNRSLNPMWRSADQVHPADDGADGTIVGQQADVTQSVDDA